MLFLPDLTAGRTVVFTVAARPTLRNHKRPISKNYRCSIMKSSLNAVLNRSQAYVSKDEILAPCAVCVVLNHCKECDKFLVLSVTLCFLLE